MRKLLISHLFFWFCFQKEIDRLASEKVELPIQDILQQLVRNSEFDLTNKLYDILQKSAISLSDISYIYLIDANLKNKNIQNAINILIHVKNTNNNFHNFEFYLHPPFLAFSKELIR